MGKSKKVDELLAQSEKNRMEMKRIQDTLEKDMQTSKVMLDKASEEFYKGNNWKPSPYLSGEQSDFMTSSSWGLDRVATMIQAISDAVVGTVTGKVPAGTEVATGAQKINDTGGISKDLRILVAANVSNLLQGIVMSFGKSTKIGTAAAGQNAPVGQGIHIFARVNNMTTQQRGFFNDETMNSYQFTYACYYCVDEFIRDGELAVIKQYNDALTANGIASSRNLEDYTNKEITYRQYLEEQKLIQEQAVALAAEIARLNKRDALSMTAETVDINNKALVDTIAALQRPLFVLDEHKAEPCDYTDAVAPGLLRLQQCLADS